MGKRYQEISDALQGFITNQKIFFVGTATEEGRVNISPKGMDSLRVLNSKRVIWLNLTGSGNETAAHIQEQSRMTLLFASFTGDPMILRLYGQAHCIHWTDPEWPSLFALLPNLPGARQIFDLQVDLVQTSCGMGVPFFDYVGEREELQDWARKKGEAGLQAYWKDRNQISLDGNPTHILDKNLKGDRSIS